MTRITFPPRKRPVTRFDFIRQPMPSQSAKRAHKPFVQIEIASYFLARF
jgi:hypothetical protein